MQFIRFKKSPLPWVIQDAIGQELLEDLSMVYLFFNCAGRH